MKLLFNLLLMPLAWLPLWILYRLSDLMAVVLQYGIRYRRKVLRENLGSAFPEKSTKTLRQIEHQYYRHVSDLIVEALYNLRATPPQILRHYRITNRQLIDRYYEQGQSVILMSAHYNNWEYMVSSLNFQLLHHGVGVGKPLDNLSFGQQLTLRRSRYGTEIVDHTNVKATFEYYHQHHIPTAYMMLSDQSPTNPHKSYWCNFLNHDTAFLYGAEYYARKYNYPVIYYEVVKVRRGFYEITLHELCTDPSRVPQYAITHSYAQRIERTIRQQPAYWLWSHRRWKLTHEGRIMKDGTLKLIKK